MTSEREPPSFGAMFLAVFLGVLVAGIVLLNIAERSITFAVSAK